tara:strand:+ start:937 stop:1410 length:474 start_codon:yes stop_codon:yes gene_type:complete
MPQGPGTYGNQVGRPPQGMTLEDDLDQVAPMQQQQAPMQPTVSAESLTPVSDAMQPGVQDEVGDFITSMVRLLESKGIELDDIGAPAGIEEQADLQDAQADPLELLTEEELIMLVEKFVALPPEVQAQLETAFREQLPPRMVNRLLAVKRFVLRGRE